VKMSSEQIKVARELLGWTQTKMSSVKYPDLLDFLAFARLGKYLLLQECWLD
jgi:hypothetical protein